MSDLKDRLAKQPPFTDEEEVKEEPKEENEGEIVEPAATTEEPAEEPVEEPTEEKALDNSKNPERTKEYIDKLKKDLDKAKDEARRVAKEGVVPSVIEEQPKPEFNWDQMLTKQAPPAQEFPGMSQKQVKDVFEGLVDEEGYVSTDLLKDELRKAHSQTQAAMDEAKKARQEAQMSRRTMDDFQRTQIAKDVHKKFDELNPDGEDFNPEYFEAVRDKMISNLAKGQPEDFMGAAEGLFERYTMTKKDKEKAKETTNAAAQINATGSKGQTVARGQYGDEAELKEAMWRNKKGAVAERLKRAGL